MSGSRFLILALLVLLNGCSWFGQKQARTQQLGPEAFYRPVPGAEDRRDINADRSGALNNPSNAMNPRPAVTAGPRTPTAIARTPATIPANVEALVAPASAPQVNGTTTPAIEPLPLGAGQYQTIGAIVVEVSGTPIYADKVVRTLTPALSAEAKQRSFEDFRGFAMSQITSAVTSLVQSELLYTAAMRNLTSEEKERANNATMFWKSQRITDAGGSVELARKRAEAEGINFDEMVADHYRSVVVYIYRSKKLIPRVPVTAVEMRQYYQDHLKKDFTAVDEAQFRVIQIMASKMPGADPQNRRTAALAKIKEIRDSVLDRSDQDFAKAASEKNDNPVLMKNGGRVGDENGWMQRGSYAITQVEEAVWKLQPGQITDVIPAGDSYYIARLTDRKLGHAKPFEDPEVQNQIVAAIRTPQYNTLQAKMIEDLQKDAIVYPENMRDWRTQPVLEMVMQQYPQWATKSK